jgi:4-alpha-glucanotransferase
MVSWWDGLGAEDRGAVLRLLEHMGAAVRQEWGTAQVVDALLAATYASASDELFIPMQDLFGWRDRINTPATVTADNWTWRLRWPVDEMLASPEAALRADFLRGLAAASGR